MTSLKSMDNIVPSRRNFLKATAAATLGGAGLAAMAGNGTQGIQAAAATTDITSLPRVKQVMVAPPFLPEHEQVATTGPKIVEVTFVIEEKKMVLDSEGTEVWALTFNGSVPGPMIVVHEGDYVELTLNNLATNMMEHNIDFHAPKLSSCRPLVQVSANAITRNTAVDLTIFVSYPLIGSGLETCIIRSSSQSPSTITCAVAPSITASMRLWLT